MRISDWSSDVCSSDLGQALRPRSRDRIGGRRLADRRRGHRRRRRGHRRLAQGQARATAGRAGPVKPGFGIRNSGFDKARFLLSESPIPNPQSRNVNRSGAPHVATHLQGNKTMATTTLNPSEISELIKTRIEKVKLGAEARNEGTVTSVSDGIVRIYGLADVMQGEMIQMPASESGADTYALALTLARDSLGAVVLGDYEHLREGRSEEHTSELQSLLRISFSVFCLK